MSTLSKFSGPDLDASAEFVHPDVWEREEHPGWSRLKFGARNHEVRHILALSRALDGPFGVLYVLLASRRGRETGRYQSSQPAEYAELELFLYTFEEFLEQDGRHHLWVSSLSGDGQFVFDNHNIVYAYGELERYERYLTAAGFKEGSVTIPARHAHNYHAEFDSAEDELMDYWSWTRYALEPDDDQ